MTATTEVKTTKPATPLPWQSRAIPGHLYEVIDAKGNPAFRIRSGMMPSHMDAAYIVAACNAYPELVAALRLIVGDVAECDGKGVDGYVSIHARARALLAKLGEGA